MVDIAKNRHTAATETPADTAPPVDLASHSAAGGTAIRAADTAAPPASQIAGANGHPATAATATTPSRAAHTAVRYLLAGIRLALGWIFVWAFFDKLIGLGHATTSAKSWINGGSPTKGFLGSASAGPFSSFYHSIAGNPVVDVLFMAALLGIGAALILGIGIRVAAAAGAVLTVMMWSAVLPPGSNPFMDDHLIYAAILIVLALMSAGDTLGLGRLWARTPLVERATWLR
jgi:thiosulfate dehydrogenase [quinone] large subunit